MREVGFFIAFSSLFYCTWKGKSYSHIHYFYIEETQHRRGQFSLDQDKGGGELLHRITIVFTTEFSELTEP